MPGGGGGGIDGEGGRILILSQGTRGCCQFGSFVRIETEPNLEGGPGGGVVFVIRYKNAPDGGARGTWRGGSNFNFKAGRSVNRGAKNSTRFSGLP